MWRTKNLQEVAMTSRHVPYSRFVWIYLFESPWTIVFFIQQTDPSWTNRSFKGAQFDRNKLLFESVSFHGFFIPVNWSDKSHYMDTVQYSVV